MSALKKGAAPGRWTKKDEAAWWAARRLQLDAAPAAGRAAFEQFRFQQAAADVGRRDEAGPPGDVHDRPVVQALYKPAGFFSQ